MIRSYCVKTSRIVILITLFGSFLIQYSSGQDIIKMKDGKEMKVIVISEGANVIQYRDFNDPTGPVYTIKKDQVESVKYKKSNQAQTETKNREKEKPANNEIVTPGIQKDQLIMTKRAITYNGQPQNPRDIKALMDPYPKVLATYEKGRKQMTLSNTCLMASLLTDLAATLIMNPKKTQEERLKVGIPALSVSGGLIITAVVLLIEGKKHVKESVSMYNEAASKPVSHKIDFGIGTRGVTFAIRF